MADPCDSPRYPPGEPLFPSWASKNSELPTHIVWGGLEKPRAGASRKQSLGRGRTPRRRVTWSDSRSGSADGSSSRSSSNQVLSERAAVHQLEALNISPGEVTFYDSSGSGHTKSDDGASHATPFRRGMQVDRGPGTKRGSQRSGGQCDGASSSASQLRERIEFVIDTAKFAKQFLHEGQARKAFLRLPHKTIVTDVIIPCAFYWNTHQSRGRGIDLKKLREEDEIAVQHPFVAAIYDASRSFERACKEAISKHGKEQSGSADFSSEADMAVQELISVLTSMLESLGTEKTKSKPALTRDTSPRRQVFSGKGRGSGGKLEALTCAAENRENHEIHDERNAQDHLLGPSSATKFQTLGNADAALQELETLKALNQATVDTYHNAMAACIAANDMATAQKIFQELVMQGQSNDDSVTLMMMARGGETTDWTPVGGGTTDFQLSTSSQNYTEIDYGWGNTPSPSPEPRASYQSMEPRTAFDIDGNPLRLPYEEQGTWNSDGWYMGYGDTVPTEKVHEPWGIPDSTAAQIGPQGEASEQSSSSGKISISKLMQAILQESDSDSDPDPADPTKQQGKKNGVKQKTESAGNVKAKQTAQKKTGKQKAEPEPLDESAVPLDEQGQLTSIGSIHHDIGKCKPCGFIGQPDGCRNGISCAFCHFKHDKVPRRQKNCKGQRDRHKKLAHRLAQDILRDPQSFDFDKVELPPSILQKERVKIKWATRLERFREEVIAIRARGKHGNAEDGANDVWFGGKMHAVALDDATSGDAAASKDSL